MTGLNPNEEFDRDAFNQGISDAMRDRALVQEDHEGNVLWWQKYLSQVGKSPSLREGVILAAERDGVTESELIPSPPKRGFWSRHFSTWR